MFEGLIEGLEGMGGWALIAGVAVVAVPVLGRVLRPVAKTAIKGGFAIADGTRTVVQEARAGAQTVAVRAQAAAGTVRSNVQEIVEEARSEQSA
ncbi:MAG: hypothetical protein M3Y56_17145 [Armatimonadota bacterium]|nr:hypothetical protein [Armatimonadota bacterium]